MLSRRLKTPNYLLYMAQFIVKNNLSLERDEVTHFIGIYNFYVENREVTDKEILINKFNDLSNTLPKCMGNLIYRSDYHKAVIEVNQHPWILVGKVEEVETFLMQSQLGVKILNSTLQRNEQLHAADQNLAPKKTYSMREALLILAQVKYVRATTKYNGSLESCVCASEEKLKKVIKKILSAEFKVLESQMSNLRTSHSSSGAIEAAQAFSYDELFTLAQQPGVDINIIAELIPSPLVQDQNLNKIKIQERYWGSLEDLYVANMKHANDVYGEYIQRSINQSDQEDASIRLSAMAITFENINARFLQYSFESEELERLEDSFKQLETFSAIRQLFLAFSEIVTVTEKAKQPENCLDLQTLISHEQKVVEFINLKFKDQHQKLGTYTLALAASITAVSRVEAFINFSVDDFLVLARDPLQIISMLNEKLEKSNLYEKYSELGKLILHYDELNKLLDSILKNTDDHLKIVVDRPEYKQSIIQLKEYLTFQYTRPSRFSMPLENFHAICSNHTLLALGNHLAILQVFIQELKQRNLIINATQRVVEFRNKIDAILEGSKGIRFQKTSLKENTKALLIAIKNIFNTYLANKLIDDVKITQSVKLTEEITTAIVTHHTSSKSTSVEISAFLNNQNKKSTLDIQAQDLIDEMSKVYYQEASNQLQLSDPGFRERMSVAMGREFY